MTAWIGPVQLVDAFYEPQITWTGVPTAQGLQAGVITGQAEWWQAHQLRELVNNPARRVTIGGQTGVLEPIYFTDDLLGPLTAWCLLQSLQLGQADQSHSLQGTTGLVPYTLTAAVLGAHRQVVITRSARAKSNDFGVVAKSTVADPFQAPDFAVVPGGRLGSREYDRTTAHHAAVPTPPNGTVPMAFRVGRVVGASDALELVVLPRVFTDGPSAPPWVTQRGGDTRAYDRQEMRDVYGPGHPVRRTTDLVITNGIVSFWVGNEGLPPFLNVQAVAGGGWREVGCLELGTSAALLSARLVRVTPDATTAALLIDGLGEAFVTLKRGSRLLRLALPIGTMHPAWKGTPPTTRVASAANGPGRFGNGLDGGGADAMWEDSGAHWDDSRYTWSGIRLKPDIRFRWPPRVSEKTWGRVLWVTANRAAADSAGAGFLTLWTQAGTNIATVSFDPADRKIKFAKGASTVASAAQTYAAGDNLLIGVRFSTTSGMALSVRAPNGVVSHFLDSTATTPMEAPYEMGYQVNNSSWGGYAHWGDDVWGGVTLYPDGVVDNDMLFDGWFTDAEFEALAAASHPLEGLPLPEARLEWYAPFDAEPIPSFEAESGGRILEDGSDDWGFRRGIAFLTRTNRVEAGAFLARDAVLDGPTDHHSELAAEFDQQLRVR